MIDVPEWLADITVAELVTFTAFAVALYAAARKVGPVMRRLGHLIDDLVGEAGRPGVPERPGVMVRLERMEERLATVEVRTAQLIPNGGSHLADAVVRLEANSRAVETRAGADSTDGTDGTTA